MPKFVGNGCVVIVRRDNSIREHQCRVDHFRYWLTCGSRSQARCKGLAKSTSERSHDKQIYPIRAGVIVLDQDPFLNGAYMGVGAAKIIDGSARNSSDLSRMTNIITSYQREPDCLR